MWVAECMRNMSGLPSARSRIHWRTAAGRVPEAALKVDHKDDAGCLQRGNHAICLIQPHGDRLLAQHMLAVLGGKDRHLFVVERRCADRDHIDIIALHRFMIVGKDVGGIVRRRQLLRTVGQHVDHGDHVRLSGLLPRLSVGIAPRTGANNADT